MTLFDDQESVNRSVPCLTKMPKVNETIAREATSPLSFLYFSQ